MKKNEKKIGGIKGFFMWLFRMDRTITEVEALNEPAPDVPMSFCETVNHIELKDVKKDASIIKTKPASSVKQSLSTKYNPNVKRGSDGRYKSLKN